MANTLGKVVMTEKLAEEIHLVDEDIATNGVILIDDKEAFIARICQQL